MRPRSRSSRRPTAYELRLVLWQAARRAAGLPLGNSMQSDAERVVPSRFVFVRAMRAMEARGWVHRPRRGGPWAEGVLTALGAMQAAVTDPAALARRPRPPRAPRTASAAAQAEGRTMFPWTLRAAPPAPLRRGGVSKLGSTVTRGRLRGLPIYYLTLEERATCPRACAVWATCYGNSMPQALRLAHGPALEAALERQVDALTRRGPLLVRLHELGDFYSTRYVALWRELLHRHAGLHVFGYTAHPPDSAIGAAVQRTRRAHPARFRVRVSGGDGAVPAARVGEPPDRRAGFACPEQHGRVADCGDCGACWSTDRTVWFHHH